VKKAEFIEEFERRSGWKFHALHITWNPNRRQENGMHTGDWDFLIDYADYRGRFYTGGVTLYCQSTLEAAIAVVGEKS